MNGQAGLPRDVKLALSYFNRSAHHARPFPMALHAMGSHFMYHSNVSERNYTLAKAFYLQAAKLGSDDALFALALLAKDSLVSAHVLNIQVAVSYLAAAASRGHVRALNYLAHALFDAESWLAQYGREQVALQRSNAYAAALLQQPFNDSSSSSALLQEAIAINASARLFVHLAGQLIALPFPVGSLEGACEAALPMMRYMTEMSPRAKDLSHVALQGFIQNDYSRALLSYEMAAELGIAYAQDNAAYILEHVFPAIYCRKASLASSGDAVEDRVRGFSSDVEGVKACRKLFQRRALLHHLHLMKLGEPVSMHKIASSLLHDNALQLPHNVSTARELLHLAGMQGHAESLLELGWLDYHGYDQVSGNFSRALESFQAALRLELLGNAPTPNASQQVSMPVYSPSRSHTAGIAPLMAIISAYADQLLLQTLGTNLTSIHARCSSYLPSSDAEYAEHLVQQVQQLTEASADEEWNAIRIMFTFSIGFVVVMVMRRNPLE
jgi:TPR repeat protein